MRVLIADDDPIGRKVLERALLHAGYEVVVACDGDQAWAVLEAPDAPRLCVLDWMMPGMDGLEVCRRVRGVESDAYTYILMVTSRDGVSSVVEALDAGADDHLGKPFDLRELGVRVRAGARIVALQAELLATKAALRELALRDPLTGLLNRRAIFDELALELRRADRDGAKPSVILFDVDHFKLVNDTFGHRAGDDGLRGVAKRALGAVRPYDRVGRYGGEEFLVVLPTCSGEQAAQVAERLRRSIEEAPIDSGASTPLRLTCSFGVATCVGDLGLESIVDAADRALYDAKRTGRNRVVVASGGG